jgi:chromosome partitioning protein
MPGYIKMPARVIAITNQKGGVGKTTTAISLSGAVAIQGKKVLLCDLDPQANATLGLGFQKGEIHYSISEILLDGLSVSSAVRRTIIENLLILPSNADSIGIEIDLIEKANRESLLKTALNPVLNDFDYIFLDCPPSLGLLTVNALVSANSVLIPMQCEFLAMEGLVQLLNTIEFIRARLNSSLEIEGIVLTMFDARTNLSKEIENEVREYFKERIRVFKTVIPRNIRLSEAPSHGLPISLYAKNTPGAWSYEALGEELVGIE